MADTIRNGHHVINLGNIYLEYVAAPRPGRRILLQKYLGMLQTPPVPKLWSLAQTKIYPLIRSRYDRVTVEIANRSKQKTMPPRAGRRFFGNLDQFIGYDHGSSIARVTTDELTEWGVTLENRSSDGKSTCPANIHWLQLGTGVWKVDSNEGYNESYLQLPKFFESLPGKGIPIAMIPNRGVLLATGSDEPEGVTALPAAARKFIQEAPWPLCGDLFRLGSNGIELFVPSGTDAKALASIQRLDVESVDAAQKTALEAHGEAIEDAVFVATYSLRTQNGDPNDLRSACAWTEGAPSLLPHTDLIAFV